jgi:prepilin-type N-terminal cleavage/methylation domain-containing protein
VKLLVGKSTDDHDRGFTIVELMVVVLIVGILATIAIASYRSLTTRAAQAACLANQRTLYDAVDVYRMQNNGSVPDTTSIDFLQDYANTWEFISVCPLDKSPLTFDSTTRSIICPNHPFP